MAIWLFVIGLAGLIIFSVIENRRYAKRAATFYHEWLENNRDKIEKWFSLPWDSEIVVEAIDFAKKKPEVFLIKDKGDSIAISQLDGDYKNTLSKKSYVKLENRFRGNDLSYSYSWNTFSVYIKFEDVILQFKYLNPILIPKREN